jgi:hypothetical protein
MRRWLCVASAIESLSLGVAERLLALWFLTHCSGFGPPMSWPIGAAGESCCRLVQGSVHPPARGLRRVSPWSSIRCALWMMRSRIASASVGLPTISYQWSTGTWLVTISEPAP